MLSEMSPPLSGGVVASSSYSHSPPLHTSHHEGADWQRGFEPISVVHRQQWSSQSARSSERPLFNSTSKVACIGTSGLSDFGKDIGKISSALHLYYHNDSYCPVGATGRILADVMGNPTLVQSLKRPHYGNPDPDGCLPDEHNATIKGVEGDVCAPVCSSDPTSPCPTDVPTGVTVYMHTPVP
eukprot:m.71730 g.71730  ORF g.71730 m.71730 type:complete len:183 (-) comp10081_c0_seq2:2351-2899(-)